MRKVKISDYEHEKHESLIALNMVGIQIDYITHDLIWDIMKIHHEKGGQANIEDCVKIKLQHEEKWERYFEQQEKKQQKEDE